MTYDLFSFFLRSVCTNCDLLWIFKSWLPFVLEILAKLVSRLLCTLPFNITLHNNLSWAKLQVEKKTKPQYNCCLTSKKMFFSHTRHVLGLDLMVLPVRNNSISGLGSISHSHVISKGSQESWGQVKMGVRNNWCGCPHWNVALASLIFPVHVISVYGIHIWHT